MLMMRLQRVGRKNDPSYRIVVTDKRTGPKSGKHVDLLGSWSPKLNQFQIDAERAKDWISKGVQLSGTLHNMLVDKKIIVGKKINVLPRKTPIVSEEAKAAEVAPASPTPPEGEVAPVAETPATEVAPVEEKKNEEAKSDEPKAGEAGSAAAPLEAPAAK